MHRKSRIHSTIPIFRFQWQKYDLARFMETARCPAPAFVQVGIQNVMGCFRLSFPGFFLLFFYHSFETKEFYGKFEEKLWPAKKFAGLIFVDYTLTRAVIYPMKLTYILAG